MIKKALLTSSLTNIAIRIVSFLGIVTYARLLTPGELGIFVIASAVVVLMSDFTLLGTNTYIIREKELEKEKMQSCIGLAALIAWGLGVTFLLLSIPIATFYNIDELAVLISILSVSFFIIPFTSSTSAYLVRNLNYEKVMVINLATALSNLIFSVLLIQLDFSFYSLAIGQLIGNIIGLIVSRLVKPATLSWKFTFKNMKPIAKVGVFTSLVNSLARLEMLLPDMIIGKTTSAEKVAIVSRAIGMHAFIRDLLSPSIINVALPYFSRVECKTTLKQNFLKAMALSTIFIAPPIAVAGVLAEPLIFLLFGPQWSASVIIAQPLALWMCLKTTLFLINPLLLADKKEKGLLILRCLGVAFLGVAITLNELFFLQNIAHAFIITYFFQAILLFGYVMHTFKISVSDIAKSLLSPFTTTCICCLAAYTLNNYAFHSLSDLSKIIAVGLCLIPIWYIMLIATKSELAKHIHELPVLNKIALFKK